MQFADLIARCGFAQRLRNWWQQIGCPHAERNVRACNYIEDHAHEFRDELDEFGNALPVDYDNPNHRPGPRQATKDAAAALLATRRVVVRGRDVDDCVDLCRFHPLESLIARSTRFRRAVADDVTVVDDAIDGLNDERDAYLHRMFGDQTLRSELPIVFWAAYEDIVAFTRAHGEHPSDIRKFLGLNDSFPMVLVKPVNCSDVHVPTGLDGFRHEHFVNSPRDAKYGRTKNLHTPGRPGAREVVTWQFAVTDTRYVKVVR